MVKVKIVNVSNNPVPEYKTLGAAGCDLAAYLPDGPITIQPNKSKLVKTGISMEIPTGMEAQVRSRSGLSLKNGIIVLNSPGTIDADYRGEIGVILYNAGSEEFKVNNGDRIAQLVFAEVYQADFVVVETLTETERADGGFGHTGVQEKN